MSKSSGDLAKTLDAYLLRAVTEVIELRRFQRPGIYRFICPDGRSYIGSTANVFSRKIQKISRRNARLVEALKEFPAEQWHCEVLEYLPKKSSRTMWLKAELRHINRLETWRPAIGFNVLLPNIKKSKRKRPRRYPNRMRSNHGS